MASSVASSASASSASASSASASSASASSALGSLISSSGFDEEVEWRELKRFPGYRIYEDGRVRGKRGNFLKAQLAGGYSRVGITEKGKVRNSQTHRLVATAFVVNVDPITRIQVDHVDSNRTNNHRLNLQWLTPSENMCKANLKFNRNRAVRSYTIDNVFLKEYSRIVDASIDTGISQSMISSCVSGVSNLSHHPSGTIYKWQYVIVKQKLLTEPDGVVIERLNMYIILSNGRLYSRFTKLLLKEPIPNSNGYCSISLVGNNGKQANHLIHRLIMEAYVGPSDLQVNHKDSVRTNNDVSNLEYVTASQNSRHAVDFGAKGSMRRSVSKIDLVTLEVVDTYVSITEAARAHGLGANSIGYVCRDVSGTRTAGGFGWRYADTNTDDIQ